MRLQLSNFTQKLDFDVLQFRRRAYKTKKKKKVKKRKKKLFAVKIGLVGIKGYFNPYDRVK